MAARDQCEGVTTSKLCEMREEKKVKILTSGYNSLTHWKPFIQLTRKLPFHKLSPAWYCNAFRRKWRLSVSDVKGADETGQLATVDAYLLAHDVPRPITGVLYARARGVGE